MFYVMEQGFTPRVYFASWAGNYSEETYMDSSIIFYTQQISLIQKIAENSDLAG